MSGTQRRIKGGRAKGTVYTDPIVEKALRAEAKRYHVSLSFVRAVAEAEALGVALSFEDRYKRATG